jgi:serine protease Do
MKKMLLALSLFFTIGLAGCVPMDINTNPGDVTTTYTEEELQNLIQSMIPESTVNTTYDLTSFQSAIKDVIEEARHGVVGLLVETDLGSSSGSGVIYKKDGNDYYLVTNAHVVENYNTVTIVYEKNGLLFQITDDNTDVIGTDLVTDLAVVHFTSDEDFNVIQFADSYQIYPGEFVFAIGNPLGFDYYGTVTMGVISGTSRYVQNGVFDATLIQHDAAISPGNSGGALIDINGELVGINNMKLVESDVSNIGFAIPSNTVKRIVNDLEDDGIVTRPYLGITTYAQVNDCGLDYGVCINIQPGGAAEAAGLQDGDIIVGWENISAGMTDFMDIMNFNELREAILNSSVGDSVVVKYIRNGEELTSNQTVLEIHPDDK